MRFPSGDRTAWVHGTLLLLLSLAANVAAAHELIVPETVQADASGEFDIVSYFEIGPGGERLAFYQYLGTENVDIGLAAEYHCIALFPEGTVIEMEFSFELTDPLQPGLVDLLVATCGVSGEQTVWEATIVVVPYEPVRPGQIWWIDSGGVYRARLDGGAPQQVVDPGSALAGGSVTVDPLDGRVYWNSWEQDLFAGVIRRARIHEGVPELFAFGGKGGLSGIATDIGRRNLYVVDPSDCVPGCGSISRVKFDGSGNQYLITLDEPQAIVVSPEQNRMCWADLFNESIQCSNLNGDNVDTLFTGVEARGLAIDGDDGRIYWSQSTPPAIRRADLDGSNAEDVITDGLVDPHGVAFDPIFRKVYWSDRETGKLQRSDPKGIHVEDLVVDLVQPSGIALDWGAGDLHLTLDDDELFWSAVSGASRFDLIRGNLDALRAAAGEYSTAEIACVVDDVSGTSADFSEEPGPGEGIFLLLRAVSVTDSGSYDSLGSRQVDGRDSEILASGGDCP